MIISDKKLIFIHIPKTGGNSFSHLLIDYSKEKIIRLRAYNDELNTFEIRGKYTYDKHQTLDQYRKKLKKNFKKYKIVSIVRNPLQRMLSLYYMQDLNTHGNWLVRKINHISKKRFGFFMLSPKFYTYKTPTFNLAKFKNHILSMPNQKSYFMINNKFIKPNYLIKYERYSDDVIKFCKSFNIDYKSFHVNKGIKGKISKKKLDKIKKIILESHHKEDYKTFGYNS